MQVLTKGSSTGEVLRRRQVGDMTLSAVRFRRECCDPSRHCHERPHLSVVFEEGPSVRSGPCPGVYFYAAGEPHSWVPRGRIAHGLNLELGGQSLATRNLTESAVRQSLLTSLDTRFLLLRIHYELMWSGEEGEAALDALLLDLLATARRPSNASEPRWVSRLRDLLRDRWNEVVLLSEAAADLGVHPVTVSKSFRRYFGCTYGEYLRKLKVERSISLVTTGESPLTAIAQRCGFADQSHFTRTFKQLTGVLPKEARRSGTGSRVQPSPMSPG